MLALPGILCHLRGLTVVHKIRKNARETPKDPQRMVHIPWLRESSAVAWLLVLQPRDPRQRSFQSVSELRGAVRGLPVAI